MLSLTACSPGRVVTRTEVVEVPRRQYVPMPAELTADVQAPAKPAPQCVESGKPTLCNSQLMDWIDDLRAAIGISSDRLRAIRELQKRVME